MTVITMSRTEIDRMSVLQDLAASRIKVTEAATLMTGSVRMLSLPFWTFLATHADGLPSLAHSSLRPMSHATSALPRLTVWRTSKPSNCGCSR